MNIFFHKWSRVSIFFDSNVKLKGLHKSKYWPVFKRILYGKRRCNNSLILPNFTASHLSMRIASFGWNLCPANLTSFFFANNLLNHKDDVEWGGTGLHTKENEIFIAVAMNFYTRPPEFPGWLWICFRAEEKRKIPFSPIFHYLKELKLLDAITSSFAAIHFGGQKLWSWCVAM